MKLSNLFRTARKALSPLRAPSDQQPEDMVRRGQQAQELLKNPLLREVVTALYEDLNTQMKAVSLLDVNSHTRLVMALQITHKIERQLVSIVENGAAAVEALALQGKRID